MKFLFFSLLLISSIKSYSQLEDNTFNMNYLYKDIVIKNNVEFHFYFYDTINVKNNDCESVISEGYRNVVPSQNIKDYVVIYIQGQDKKDIDKFFNAITSKSEKKFGNNIKVIVFFSSKRDYVPIVNYHPKFREFLQFYFKHYKNLCLYPPKEPQQNCLNN